MRLIDADALMRKLGMAQECENCPNCTQLHFCGLSREESAICDVISETPTIDPVKHGKWEPHPTEPDWDVCTSCGCGTMRRTHGYHNGGFWDAEESYLYCPWCGALMER